MQMEVDREWLKTVVKITLDNEPENSDDIDNWVDTKSSRQWIRAQLAAGNTWAWCTAKVTGRYMEFEETDFLGHCSYESKEDFMRPGLYYDDMVDTVVEAIAARIEAQFGDHRLWQHDKKSCLFCIGDAG